MFSPIPREGHPAKYDRGGDDGLGRHRHREGAGKTRENSAQKRQFLHEFAKFGVRVKDGVRCGVIIERQSVFIIEQSPMSNHP
jgi:hypothetical protein